MDGGSTDRHGATSGHNAPQGFGHSQPPCRFSRVFVCRRKIEMSLGEQSRDDTSGGGDDRWQRTSSYSMLWRPYLVSLIDPDT